MIQSRPLQDDDRSVRALAQFICLRRTVFVLGVVCWAGSTVCATENWQVGDTTYANVRVREITPASVTIFHHGGVAQIALEDLPPDLQQRFGFDAAKAAAWRAQTNEQLAANRERRIEAMSEVERRSPVRSQPDATRGDRPVVEYRNEVDLRPIYRDHGLIMKSQGRRPSCSVFAVVGALEYELARTRGSVEPLSEEFLIWAVRELQPGIPIDDGFNFGEVISALQTYGVPTQNEMPNTFGKKTEEIIPTPEARNLARHNRGVVPIWFRPEDPYLVDRIIGALNDESPVIIGVRWPHWRTLRHNNLLRDQQPLDGAAHAVTLIGYQSAEGGTDGVVFLFRNSYGIDWGLGGCGFMAASYLREHVIGACVLTIPDP